MKYVTVEVCGENRIASYKTELDLKVNGRYSIITADVIGNLEYAKTIIVVEVLSEKELIAKGYNPKVAYSEIVGAFLSTDTAAEESVDNYTRDLRKVFWRKYGDYLDNWISEHIEDIQCYGMSPDNFETWLNHELEELREELL